MLLGFHERFARAHPAAAKLHCVYVLRTDVGAVERRHLAWAHGRLLRRPLGVVGRVELLRCGCVVHGPPPAAVVPPVEDAELRSAVRRQLSGYWRRTTRLPWLWLQDAYVDLGLLTLARAEATLADASLITKAEALARLPRFGVPAGLCAEIASRRRGEDVRVSTPARVRRALLARRLVARGIRTLAG